jgi:hypothetical protein
MDPSDTRNAYFDPGSVTGDFPVEDGLETVTIAAPAGGTLNWWLIGAVVVGAYFLLRSK